MGRAVKVALAVLALGLSAFALYLWASPYLFLRALQGAVLEGDRAYLLENPDVQEFYLGVAKEGGRKSFKEVKAYKRRKRFM